MKKAISFLLGLLLCNSFHVNGMTVKYIYPLDQVKAKKEALMSDGVSVVELEQHMKQKYPNITNVLLVNKFLSSLNEVDLEMDAAYGNDQILLSSQNMHKLTSRAYEWDILHEAGHAQQPYNIFAIQGAVGITQLLTGYYWGMHKKGSYKNRLTKLGSKTFAAILAGSIVNCALMQAEERRADNWANSVADKKALLGGIEYFNFFKLKAQNKWSEYKISSIIPFSVAKHMLDPIHPSIESRIAKINKVKKERFSL